MWKSTDKVLIYESNGSQLEMQLTSRKPYIRTQTGTLHCLNDEDFTQNNEGKYCEEMDRSKNQETKRASTNPNWVCVLDSLLPRTECRSSANILR